MTMMVMLIFKFCPLTWSLKESLTLQNLSQWMFREMFVCSCYKLLLFFVNNITNQIFKNFQQILSTMSRCL